MGEKKTKVELEARIAELEAVVKPMAQFGKQLVLAEHRGARVLDVGLRIDQLRPMVECAELIVRGETDGEVPGGEKAAPANP